MLKTKKFRRLLAGLLAVLMLSICIPAMALAEGKAMESKYTVHFVDEDGDKIAEPVVVNMSWAEGQQLKLMDQLQSTIDSVKGYTFSYLTAWNGTEAYKGDELVVAGEYEVTAHYTTNAQVDVNSKYTGNLDDFNSEVRRERAVELAYEGFRFNDLRRWLLLTVYPYNIKTSQEFDRVELNTDDPTQSRVANWREEEILRRNLSEKHYWMPLKTNDVTIYPEFYQNPGW